MRRLFPALLTLALASPIFAIACSKPSAPEPTPAASDDDDKDKPAKKKKKPKKADDDDDQNAASDDTAAPTTTATGVAKPGLPTVKPTASASGTASDATEKAKLVACCTALRNAANAVAAAKTAASNTAIPGMPATPPPQVDPAELDKAVKACDAQVAQWSGDLNTSLSKVKNASKITLPAACSM